MRWITRIAVDNYRAFAGPYRPIDIEPGHHLLLYGENGSGKSSVYTGLRDFFFSSDTYKPFELHRFDKSVPPTGSVTIDVAELNAGYIRTRPQDASYRYSEIDDGGIAFPEIQIANKLKGFLDYRRLLQTHLVESPPGTNPNLFSLIIEDMLADHYIAKPGGGVMQVRLADEWLAIKSDLALDRRTVGFKSATRKLPDLEATLKILLTKVFAEAKTMLSNYFKAKIELNVDFRIGYEVPTRRIIRDLFLKVTYAKEDIPGYQLFLNEARLSALAICVYLASIKTRPLSGPGTPHGGNDTLKVLFLDDVFIGLDTGNRIPLLEILQKEFVQSGYQLFLSTYDRHWFETAKHWFQTEHSSVKSIELFSDDHDNDPATPDIPVVIDPSLGSLEKARAYFRYKDYPAAANYLRKACEEELKRILPTNLLLRVDHNTDEVKSIIKLETLVNNFDIYLAKNGLNAAPFRHFKTYKKILLNPLSHDDLSTPHYAREIRDGITLVEELQKLRTKQIVLAADSLAKPMKLGMRDQATHAMHLYEIRLFENLQILKQDMGNTQLSIVECDITEAGMTRHFISLDAAFGDSSILS